MNIIDAIKSGKSFRRKDSGRVYWYKITDAEYNSFSPSDILADWEIEEARVTITSTQFWDAYTDALTTHGTGGHIQLSVVIQHIAKKLGVM